MAVTIQIKRGAKAGLPALAPGEYGLATDTGELFVGGNSGNIQVATLGSDGKIPEGRLPEMDYDPAGSAAAVQTNLTSHVNNKNNPHGVTAAQVGAYTKEESLAAATAGLYGLGSDAVPDDVLKLLDHSVQFYSSQTPKYQEVTVDLSTVQEGDIVQLEENGVLVDFYVAKLNYESTLNGTGRTLVFRKDCYDERQWHISNVNAYASSAIDSWLNSTYKNMLDADIRELIGSTKIRYTPGNGNTTMGTLDRAVFLLSAYELGKSESWFNKEGTTLPNATNYQIAKLNGSTVVQWTRSPRVHSTNDAVYLDSGGHVSYDSCDYSYGSRPAFTLPSTFSVTYYVDSSGNLHDEQEYDETGSTTDVKGNPITIGAQIATGSYVGTGTYGASNPNTLTFEFEPKVVFIQGTSLSNYSGYFGGCFVKNASAGPVFMSTENNNNQGAYWAVMTEWDGKSFAYYSKVSNAYQMNLSGGTYTYLAIG